MAHALQIDTLAFSKKLKEAGADDRLADAIVEGLTAADTSELATKSDVAKVESGLKQDILKVENKIDKVESKIVEVKAELKQDIAEVKGELKADIAEVRTEIADVKSDLTTLIMQSSNRTIYIIGGLIGLLFAIDKLLPLAGLE